MSERVLRFAVRVVLVDATDAVLLLSTRDASNPAFGTSWELPGGGIVAGESLSEAAVREIREETGILLSAPDLGRSLWHRDVRYTYRGERRLQREAICVARISGAGPAIDGSGREAVEQADHQQFRWWPVAELRTSAARFYPRSLPKHIDALLTGGVINEPDEEWDE
ncbi:NUDIX hydrolase [Azohydromonas lata]|uniref:NUDIX hydrolase n=1 Tax=Azohydromonas lata TaxID=45677 RepID=UPI000829F11C|nr:NUDIX domain-containing protein [Azohydromonas lata]